GLNTQLNLPSGIDIDSHGNIYAANGLSESITIYGPRSDGNEGPIAIISGPATGLNGPLSVKLDPADQIWVANATGNSVNLYPAGSNGNVAPIASINTTTAVDYEMTFCPSAPRAGD